MRATEAARGSPPGDAPMGVAVRASAAVEAHPVFILEAAAFGIAEGG
eukprot:CAMPEP_0198702192 /NCGR_PEP_ID=MMETSP1468-20131203/388616_1 /TAXON_ID=1461545 /ORGANISM="Mantoniella sp, Strain CCMP1436" /LENGTH=46 /DNA_ID= /DNA_START= /DNA_END= /DNA_ORIENTATION=